MKFVRILGVASALCLSAMPLTAQEANEVEQLRRQLKQLQDQFEKQQQLQRQQIEALQKQIESLQQTRAASPPPSPTVAVPAPETASPPASMLAAKPWRPSDPMRLGRGQSYVDLSFDGLFAAGGSTARDIEGGTQLGGHDPVQRGFTVQNLEMVLSGAVDPYFRGQANLIFQIDSGGASRLEVEEAYLESLGLPANLQLRAGQFFTEFGRLNPQHPHSWSFVDQPLVNGRFFGGDGLRSAGARLSWLVPTPFYSELFLTVQNSQGETAHSFRSDHGSSAFLGRLHTVNRLSSLSDLLFTPRYAASFDLTDTQTLLLGTSAAFGPNASGTDKRTQIYGVDLFWKWKPTTHDAGFPFVSWQTEAMLRRYSVGAFNWDLDGDAILDPGEQDANGDGVADTLANELLTDYGMYSQISYGFKRGWAAALRGDYVTRTRQAAYEVLYGNDPDRLGRWRIAPNLTWFPSEYSKIRLQYNYDYRNAIGPDHSVWLQFEYLLGAHAAHKF